MTRYSLVQLGKTVEDDERLSELVGGSGEKFLILAQRVVWGTDQADLVRVDVPVVARKLVERFPDTPASYAIAAYGMRRHDRAVADQIIARGWEHPAKDHPHRYLLPERAEWEGHKPAQRLTEVVPGHIWQVLDSDSVTGGDLARSNVATLVRTQDAGLVIVNPLSFSDEVTAEIRKLGEVGALVVQGAGHSRGLEPAAARFPEATTYATRSHRTHPPAAKMRFEKLLDEQPPSKELSAHYVGGALIDEQVLWHEPTRSLIIQDIVMGNFRDTGLPYSSLVYYFAFGIEDRLGVASYFQFLIKDLLKYREGFQRLASLRPERILDAHIRVVEGEAVKGLSEISDWLGQLSPAGHKRMLVRYFSKQPGFLRDLIRYQLAQRKLRAS